MFLHIVILMFQEKMYWSDWDTAAIYEADKLTGDGQKELVSIDNVMSVRVSHPVAQPVSKSRCQGLVLVYIVVSLK